MSVGWTVRAGRGGGGGSEGGGFTELGWAGLAWGFLSVLAGEATPVRPRLGRTE